MSNSVFLRKSILIFFSTSLALWAVGAHALNEDRLWLPLSYQKLYLKLKDAAQAAEDLDRCVDVLDGTIDLERSTDNHPIFRIRCKQENGKTYSEMVDGITNETLTTPLIIKTEPTEAELEQRRLEEEKRKLEEKQARIQLLWNLCARTFHAKTKLMINLSGPKSEDELKPEVYDEEHAIFVFDFDAEDIAGGQLSFRGNCDVNDEQVLSFHMGKRPDLPN